MRATSAGILEFLVYLCYKNITRISCTIKYFLTPIWAQDWIDDTDVRLRCTLATRQVLKASSCIVPFALIDF